MMNGLWRVSGLMMNQSWKNELWTNMVNQVWINER
jgi:hypothetical protein